MKRKALALLLAAVMTTAMLAGCGSSSSDNAAGSGAAAGDTAAQSEAAGNEAAASGDKTVINFYYSTDLEKTASKEIAAFNAANSDIEVVGHSVAEDNYDDKVKVMTAGGSTEADIYWVRTPAQMAQYTENGAFVDLAPYAESTGVDLSPIKDSSLAGVTMQTVHFTDILQAAPAGCCFTTKNYSMQKALIILKISHRMNTLI